MGVETIYLETAPALRMWCDVFDITWMCFGCNSNTYKHVLYVIIPVATAKGKATKTIHHI